MTDAQVVEYISLVDRRLQILINSGINWKPEYEAEMRAIDKRLAELKTLVDAEHERREYAHDTADKEMS